ncbi:hypothetical protein FRC11_004365 [Ceratobasidium sp. 423]|nr:hypothetical protein FRC11_004365 [Ceratobasidium sp. 423]
MDYNTSRVDEQSFTQNAPFDVTGAGDDTAFSYYMDEAQLELLDPAVGNSSEAHLPPRPQWDAVPDIWDGHPSLPETYSTLNASQAPSMPYSAQQYDCQVDECAPYYFSFDDVGDAATTASCSVQLPESSLCWPSPQTTFAAPSPGELPCPESQPGQYYPDQGQASICNTVENWKSFDMLMHCSTGAPIQVPEDTHTPIEPLQMHLTDPTFAFETGVESGESTTSREQFASSSSTTVEQLSPSANRAP